MEARSEKLWWRRGGRGFLAFGSNLGGIWVVFGLAFGRCLAFGVWVEDDDDDDGFGMNRDGDGRPSLSRHRCR